MKKVDRYAELFELPSLRVRSLAGAATPLFASLSEWFDASKRMLATAPPADSLQVQPSSQPTDWPTDE